jgi:predicted enzyme involved in methoxymalonyl-ACP biosynthesis
MSCRAFGRGLEYAFLSRIAEQANSSGAKNISIAFTPNEKNAPAKEFVDALFPAGTILISAIPSAPPWIRAV